METNLHTSQTLKVVKFDESDIKANKNGLMTYQQAQVLLSYVLRYRLVTFFMAGVTVFIISASIRIPYEKGYLADFHFYFAGILLLLFLITILSMPSIIIKLRQDIAECRVSQISGMIKIRKERHGAVIIIDKLRFSAPYDFCKNLKSGMYYTLYYATHSKMLLSVE